MRTRINYREIRTDDVALAMSGLRLALNISNARVKQIEEEAKRNDLQLRESPDRQEFYNLVRDCGKLRRIMGELDALHDEFQEQWTDFVVCAQWNTGWEIYYEEMKDA